MLIAFILGALTVGLFLFYVKYLRLPSAGNIPVAQMDSVFLGHLRMLADARHKGKAHILFEELYEKYGSPYALRLPGMLLIMCADPEINKQVLFDPDTFAVNKRFLHPLSELLNLGLLPLDGPVWKRHRKMLQPAFAPSHLKRSVDVTNHFVSELFAEWKTKKTVDVHHEFTNLALFVVGKWSFGIHLGEVEMDVKGETFHDAINRMAAGVEKRSSIPKFLWNVMINKKERERYYAAIKVGKDTVGDVLKAKHLRGVQDESKLTDLMDYLLLAKDENGNKFSDIEIQDETLMFLFGGLDTVANTMAWVTYNLGRNPQVLEKVKQEVRALCPDRHPTYEDLGKFKYLENVIKESLRVTPTTPLTTRRCTRDVVVKGYTFPKDSIVFLNWRNVNMDAKYHENPLVFDPDRWDRYAAETKQPCLFVPFSDGPKNCIGQKFAILEIKAMFIRMMQEFPDFAISPGQKIEPIMSVTLGRLLARS
eukprot:TRINITY_DN2178_c0_g1_i2.p1 TRINITY_DN2178_c0_g1~~TRINITY_DN2178_c0_g1_i2.p1  ORF type:complete len:479 (-),score=109.67 TRINITY_DN2178_c0_g1_i2:92-1528(-)